MIELPGTARVKLRYFAWVREKTGISEEVVELPAGIETGIDLIRWMQTRGDPFARAFERPEAIRLALDHKHIKAGEKISGAREIGFFPPVTGG